MDEKFIKDVFDPFYLKLAIINYKLKSHLELTDEQKNYIKILSYFLPIINGIYDRKPFDLGETINKLKNLYCNYILINGNINHSNHNNNDNNNNQFIENDEYDEFDEHDEIGDKMVDELTNKSLLQLQNIKNNKWIFIKDNMEDETNKSEYYSDNEYYQNEQVDVINNQINNYSQYISVNEL